MAHRANTPGCPCCDCECVISPNFDGWTEEAGDWTTASTSSTWSAYTEDSDAELVCDVAYAGKWMIASFWISPYFSSPTYPVRYGIWYRVGFRDASGDNRLYLRWKLESGNNHTIQLWEVASGTATMLDEETGAIFLINGCSGSLAYDPDADTFAFQAGQKALLMRVSSSVAVDRMFVATETLLGRAQFIAYAPRIPGDMFRKCIRIRDNDAFNEFMAGPAAMEYEVTISGVTAGTGTNGSTYYDEFNDTFVLMFDVYRYGVAGANDRAYVLTYTHAQYGRIELVLTLAYSYARKQTEAKLWIQIQQPESFGAWPIQCVRFEKIEAGACSFDWRTLNHEFSYAASRCNYGGDTSHCLKLDSDANAAYGNCKVGGDFSAATVTVTAVP